MSTTIDKTQHYKTIRKTCFTANTLYLIVHIFYLILFLIEKLNILTIIDAGIIVIYLLFFLLLKKKKYYLYALLCGNLFFVFVSVATILLGFNSGFHFYLIGLSVVSFFTTYFSKTRNIKGSIVWVGLSLTIYLVLYFTTKNKAPYYPVSSWLEVTLFVLHAVLVFAFVATYLVVFLKYALSLENKIINESRTDELTQINNRYGLYDFFDLEEDKSNLVLALFDIDDFKMINDAYGHITGDHILTKVAEITVNVLNDSFVCRYGGEEFVVVLKDNGEASVYDRLEGLRKSIEKEVFEFEGEKAQITITTGAKKYTKDISLENWVEEADKLMYSGKNSGKNQTVVEAN